MVPFLLPKAFQFQTTPDSGSHGCRSILVHDTLFLINLHACQSILDQSHISSDTIDAGLLASIRISILDPMVLDTLFLVNLHACQSILDQRHISSDTPTIHVVLLAFIRICFRFRTTKYVGTGPFTAWHCMYSLDCKIKSSVNCSELNSKFKLFGVRTEVKNGRMVESVKLSDRPITI
jgi:hypothetical protein